VADCRNGSLAGGKIPTIILIELIEGVLTTMEIEAPNNLQMPLASQLPRLKYDSS